MWPDVQPGQPDNVVAQGQTILLSGSGTTLGVLGAASPSNVSGSGRVYYTDGTTSGFSITLDNYFNPPVSNDVIATLPYCNASNPAKGDGGSPASARTPSTSFTHPRRSRRARRCRRSPCPPAARFRQAGASAACTSSPSPSAP